MRPKTSSNRPVVLTDKFARGDRAVPAAGPPGTRPARREYTDALVPGLSLRVSGSGHRVWILSARYPAHPEYSTRRTLGDARVMGVEAARETARAWLTLISRGIDPAQEVARAAAAAEAARASTFKAVWAAFERDHASKLAKAQEAKRAGEAFCKLWGARGAAEVTPAEISAHIREVAAKTPDEARNRLGHLSRMYSWAIGVGAFGLQANPVKELTPKDLIGERTARDRTLTDAELRSVWAAAAQMGETWGSIIRLLVLTGQRLNEVVGARWSEIDLDAGLWTIPAVRMKMKRAHVVPLAPMALAVLRELPHWAEGDCLFSVTGGARPVTSSGHAKRRLDKVCDVQGWRLHDLRRTFRTKISALKIEDRVREQMIAHSAPGLHRVYDQHAYLDEKRAGFRLWEAELSRLLAPRPPAEVVELRPAAA